jgi:hypothetical protein
MATQTLEYAHPVHLVPVIYSGATTAGANGVTTKFAAYTSQKVMSLTYSANIASTSATQPLLYSKSGTTTTTSTPTSVGSAVVSAINYAFATPLALAQGDQFWLAHGTDTTVSLSVAVETLLVPGASITK